MRYSGDYFKVRHINNSHELCVRGETLESTRQEIADAEARAIAKGYPAEEWIITHVEWYRYFGDDGIFQKEERYEQFVEKYPV